MNEIFPKGFNSWTAYYRAKEKKEKRNYWICAVPATFMSAVSMTYFMMAGECMGLIAFFKNNKAVGYPVGLIFAALCLYVFLKSAKKVAGQSSKLA